MVAKQNQGLSIYLIDQHFHKQTLLSRGNECDRDVGIHHSHRK